MIPKIIHYCWFGGNPKNKRIEKCMETWKLKCPDYEFMEWNEDNFNVDDFLYVREAYNLKKWAYVSDVVRLYALDKYGGIYLDTDVEIVKDFSDLLLLDGFLGFEGKKWIATSVMGARKHHPIISNFLKAYEQRTFYLNSPSNVVELTNLLVKEYGLQLNGEYQKLDGIDIFPSDYFSPYDYLNGKLIQDHNTYAIHWYDMSWVDQSKFRKYISRFYHRLIGKKLK